MKELKKKLGLTSVVSISVGSMLGTGIFVLPGVAFAQTGPSTYLAFLLAAVCILPAALSKSELATAMPTSGGTYIYLERTFGPLAGTIAGIGLFLSILLKCSFALIGFGAYLSIMTSFPLIYIAMTILGLIVLLNILGVGKVSKAMVFIVAICIGLLLFLAGESVIGFEAKNLTPLFPFGPKGFLIATGIVFISYSGILKVVAIAEEIAEPEKTLPKGIFISLLIVTIIYVSLSFIMAGHFPQSFLGGNLKPIYELAKKTGGPILGTVFAVLGIIIMSSVANAGILAASRFPFAMGRDQLLPSLFGQLNKKFLTPVSSILLSGIIIAFIIYFIDAANMAKLGSAFILMIFIAENIAVIVLREARVQWYKPGFKSPFYPWVQIFGIITGVAIYISMGKMALYSLLFIVFPSTLVYFFYGRSLVSRKGVLGIRGRRKDLLEEGAMPISPNQSTGINHKMFDFVGNKADVVVALFGKERSPETLVEMASSLVGTGNLEVAHLIEVPEQIGVRDLKEEFTTVRSLRRRLGAMEENLKLLINYDPIVSHDILKTVHEISNRLDCHWLFTEWGGNTGGAFTLNNPIAWLKDHLSCSLVVFRDAGVRNFKKIMVFIHDLGSEFVVVNLADHLGKVHNAELTLVRFLYEHEYEARVDKEKKFLNETAAKCQSSTNIIILRGEKKVSTILAITPEFDLMVYGDFRNETFIEKIFGTVYDKVTSKAACSVISLQKYVGH